jgi:hypothetical protein
MVRLDEVGFLCFLVWLGIFSLSPWVFEIRRPPSDSRTWLWLKRHPLFMYSILLMVLVLFYNLPPGPRRVFFLLWVPVIAGLTIYEVWHERGKGRPRSYFVTQATGVGLLCISAVLGFPP